MRLCLGGAQVGMRYGVDPVQLADRSLVSTLAICHANGVGIIDTAPAYEQSEKLLGQLANGRFLFNSKLSAVGHEQIFETIESSVERTLIHLGVESINGILLHRPMELMGKSGDKIYSTLSSLKDRGMIERIGISVYEPDEVISITGRYEIDSIQVPYSIFDRRFRASNLEKILQQVEVQIRSIFLQGLLVTPAAWNRPDFNEHTGILNTWQLWLSDNNISPVEACVRFAYFSGFGDTLLFGVTDERQATEFFEAVQKGPLGMPIPDFSEGRPDLLDPRKWKGMR